MRQTLFYLIYNRNIQNVRITKTAQHVSDRSLRQSLERISQIKFNVGQQPIEHIHKRSKTMNCFISKSLSVTLTYCFVSLEN